MKPADRDQVEETKPLAAPDPCEGVAKALARDATQDQADRSGGWEAIDWEEVNGRDAARRERVKAWEDNACIRSAASLQEAALIMQHGKSPEDFQLGYTFLTKAEALTGEVIRLRALAADRWLVAKEHKQWFLSQALRPDMEGCWCLAPYEEIFTDEERVARGGRDLQGAKDWLSELNSSLSDCTDATLVCDTDASVAPLEAFPELRRPPDR